MLNKFRLRPRGSNLRKAYDTEDNDPKLSPRHFQISERPDTCPDTWNLLCDSRLSGDMDSTCTSSWECCHISLHTTTA